jgi:hypothetical protein
MTHLLDRELAEPECQRMWCQDERDGDDDVHSAGRALVAASGSRHPSEATYLSARITTAVARHVLSIVERTKASDVVSLRGRGNRILTLWMNIP